MKIFFLFFFLSSAMLTGCSTNYNYPSKKITVHKISGAETDYGLLSVRGDSAIVVLAWQEMDVFPIPFSHTQMIKRDSIAWIAREGNGPRNATWQGILIGAGIGTLGSALFIQKGDFDAGTAILYGITSGAWKILMGLGGGGFIGGLLSTQIVPDLKISLSSAKDREFLRSISAYPDKEPPEIQYIK